MAKIKFGNGIADIRGKIGGDVYSRNKGGAYKRNVGSYAYTPTSYQIAESALFSSIAAYWSNNLNDTERRAWNVAVSNWKYDDIFAQGKELSGYQLFRKLNGNILKLGGSVINLPPIKTNLDLAPILDFTGDSATQHLDISFDWAEVPIGSWLEIWTSSQVNQGVSYYRNIIKLLLVAGPHSMSTLHLHFDYIPRFGALIAGKRIYCEVFVSSAITGQKGSKQSINCIIT